MARKQGREVAAAEQPAAEQKVAEPKVRPHIAWVELRKLKDNMSQPSTRREARRMLHLRKGITERGVICPPVVDQNLMILDGHRRVAIMLEQGWTHYWVTVSPVAAAPGVLNHLNGLGTSKMSPMDAFHAWLESPDPDAELAELAPMTARRISILRGILGRKVLAGLAGKIATLNVADFPAWARSAFAEYQLDLICDKQVLSWAIAHSFTNLWLRRLRDHKTRSRVVALHQSISTGAPYGGRL